MGLRAYIVTCAAVYITDDFDLLLTVNPTYATIRYPYGRETSISLKDLAPYPSSTSEPSEGVDETAQLADSVA